MFESFLGFIRKRRRVDGETGTSTPAAASSYPNNANRATFAEFGSPSPHLRTSSINGNNSGSLDFDDADVVMGRALDRIIEILVKNIQILDSEANLLHSSGNSFGINSQPNQRQHRAPLNQHSCEEAMEIDSTPVPPPQEYSDSPSFQSQHSESSMNFDYLSSLHSSSPGGYNSAGGMDLSSTAPGYSSSFRKGTDSLAHVDDRVAERPFNLNERFVGVLDQLDARVEKFRKDAMGLQEKRDFLLMSIDLIKTNDLLHGMNEAEREEISCYIQRVNSRLSTVELNVRTVRDTSQEDSLSQINMLIDMMITLGDPVLSRQRCQQYLNACGSFEGSINMGSFAEHGSMGQDVIVDKKFESALLGCTLDDQKNVKKRLQALMGYLNKQTIRD